MISDDTNYYNAMRRDLIEIARRNNTDYAIVYVYAPVEYALKWNRERGEPIPPEVIQRIHERFDVPGKKYRWDQPIVSIDSSETRLEEAVKTILQKLDELKPQGEVKRFSDSGLGMSEEIDRVTRRIVGRVLAEGGDERLARRLSSLRRSFVREALERNLSLAQVESEFTERVRSVLNGEAH